MRTQGVYLCMPVGTFGQLVGEYRVGVTLMKRRLGASLIAVATCAAGMVAVSSPADAVTPYCPSGYACMWKDIHYVTNGSAADFFKMFYYAPDLSNFSYPGGNGTVWRSISSSYDGASSERVYYFKGASCTGSSFSEAAQSGDSDYTNGTPSGSWNEQTESAAFASEIGNC